MARAWTKCADCGDIMWFGDNDSPPQAVVCPCGCCKLTEDGPEGNYEELTTEEVEALPQ